MKTPSCACGSKSGTNQECERCRLIAECDQLLVEKVQVAWENEKLTERVGELERKTQGYVEHIQSALAEIEQLKTVKFRHFANQDCWIYQGDGEDKLESLVCPVVVSPQKMIELETSKRIADSFVRLDDKASGKLQQRVTELEMHLTNEQFASTVIGQRCSELEADNARLTAELSELRRLVNRHDHDYLAVHKELDKAYAENVSLRELLRDACKSFECYAAHDKPESQWDEYDHMMNPIWRRIKAAIEKGSE